MRRTVIASASRRFAIATAAALVACGGGETAGPGPAGASISLAVAPPNLTVAIGGVGTITATVTRGGGYAGTITFGVTGLPNGVTLQANTQSTSGAVTAGVILLNPGAGAVAGTSTLTISASGSGVTTVTGTVTLTITGSSGGIIFLVLSPNALTIAQGGNSTTNITIARTNFTGPTTLSAEGLPSGATPVFNPTSSTGSSSVLTISVGAAVAAQVYQVTIRLTGLNVPDATAQLTLTVTAAGGGGFTLSAAAVSIPQGASGQTIINIARTGTFTGAVALTVEGAPQGLTATPNPASATGNSTLMLTAAANLAAATYNLTIRGTGANVTQQTTVVAVTVTATGGGGSATLNFTQCAASAKPIWFAFQDGSSGAWVRVVGVGDVYTFTITQAKGGYAYVTTSAGSGARTTTIFLGTQTEATAGGAPVNFCVPGTPATKTILGSVSNVTGTQQAFISLGNRFAFALAALPNFTLTTVPNGEHDLVAFRSDVAPSAADRGLIRPSQNLADGTNVGVLNMAAGESFAAATGTFTVNGLAAGEMLNVGMSLASGASGASCDASLLYAGQQPTAQFTLSGMPDDKIRPTDMHMLNTSTFSATGFRQLTETFHSVANRAINLPEALAPIVLAASGNYKRVNAAFNLPAEYNVFVAATHVQTTGLANAIVMSHTAGWIGTGVVGVVTPIFSGIAGWDDSWAPAFGSPATWTIIAAGSNLPPAPTLCAAGIRNRTASRTGSF